MRLIQLDACVEVEGNCHSVLWALLKQQLTVLAGDQQVQIPHGGRVVARHLVVAANRRHRSVLRGQWNGLVPALQRELAEPTVPSAAVALCVNSALTTSPPCGS